MFWHTAFHSVQRVALVAQDMHNFSLFRLLPTCSCARWRVRVSDRLTNQTSLGLGPERLAHGSLDRSHHMIAVVVCLWHDSDDERCEYKHPPRNASKAHFLAQFAQSFRVCGGSRWWWEGVREFAMSAAGERLVTIEVGPRFSRFQWLIYACESPACYWLRAR